MRHENDPGRDWGRVPRTFPSVRSALVLAAPFVLLVALVPTGSAGPSAPSDSGSPGVAPGAGLNTSVTLSVSGIAPGAAGLSWTAATDLLFTHYEVYESTSGSGGPWTDLGSVTSQSSTTYFVDALTPDTSYAWEVSVTDSLEGTAMSNVATAATPAVAAATASPSAASAVNVTWTNPAVYSTIVQFQSYEVDELAASGPASVLASITSVSDRSYDVSGLANNTSYSFQVTTTDACGAAANCGAGSQPTSTASRTASVTTTATLHATVNAHRGTFAAGTNATFACSALGGKHPYAFAWSFGDGTTASGAFVTHDFADTGNFTVGCTVSDQFGSTTHAATTVEVTARTSGSGGGGGSGSGGEGGGGSTGRTGGLGSILGPIAAAALVVAFVAAVLALMVFSRRRRKEPDGYPPTGAGVVLSGDPPPSGAVPAESPTEGPPSADAGPPGPLHAPPGDLDRLMDELENASTDAP